MRTPEELRPNGEQQKPSLFDWLVNNAFARHRKTRSFRSKDGDREVYTILHAAGDAVRHSGATPEELFLETIANARASISPRSVLQFGLECPDPDTWDEFMLGIAEQIVAREMEIRNPAIKYTDKRSAEYWENKRT